ncbi:imidazole glycerol-phosphate synthase [Buchnera aphidicola (Cinara tujafilina)]|uniref:imidazole glycerol-phosphate synthase n=1 Tax=Buchnera aphidicola (Cinara tujafilina) TaxID=261317 RepID=F7WZ12_9GAMM|nr:imidazole glycerol phosphate synthase subunit HisF [Buchnera aphidicola]AEH39662.1 imidazole glycerol-phosphate synthase [Buchnera aphidicola (Cinara tujafilina)]
MLAKRIIACLDIKDGYVVKGMQFKKHRIIGDIIKLAEFYSNEGIDELVLYDIEASSYNRVVNKNWVSKIAEVINIPFSVAGGINSIQEAAEILKLGADKISINSPALLDPFFISRLADRFGSQCVVIGVDSWFDKTTGKYGVFQYTGNLKKICQTPWKTLDWIKEIQSLGAGEIVLNTMNTDGMKSGYDINQLLQIQEVCKIPLIASGGAGTMQDFLSVFQKTRVDGALAASVFHNKIISINILKDFLIKNGVEIRKCLLTKI